MFDPELLVYRLLSRDAPDSIQVHSEYDVTTWDNLPYSTFVVITEPSGNSKLLWSCTLIVNAFGDGALQAIESAETLYDIVHGWAVPGNGNVAELGTVESVDDVSLFARISAVPINGKNVTQYSGTFTLNLRSPVQ